MDNKKIMDVLKTKKDLLEKIQNENKPITLSELVENNNYQLDDIKPLAQQLFNERCIKNGSARTSFNKPEQIMSMELVITRDGIKFLKRFSNEDRLLTAQKICEELDDDSNETFELVYKGLKQKEMYMLIEKYCGTKWNSESENEEPDKGNWKSVNELDKELYNELQIIQK